MLGFPCGNWLDNCMDGYMGNFDTTHTWVGSMYVLRVVCGVASRIERVDKSVSFGGDKLCREA